MHSSLVRVAVVTTDEIVAAGIEQVLSASGTPIEVVALDPSGAADAPDVVLYDVKGLHDGDAGELEHLVKETPSVVVALAQDLRPELAQRALELGVAGCISLAAQHQQLTDLVRAAAAGELAGEATLDTPGLDQTFERVGGDARLTPRELEVLRLITRGLSNVEVAGQLFVSINTIKSCIRSAYRKMGVTTRSQAVAWCLQHGVELTSDS
ncbi:response regulator transcription factor [Nocardioides sp. SYSU D00038]|uniref:response regulator transcription factor n=1 Tax=Nocardioides sp. SYSU D00038 TaxID=2812554 RepID=UPI001966DC6D|nr:response regulator transcription factor [Nocardioides sp. SYSU D00038]